MKKIYVIMIIVILFLANIFQFTFNQFAYKLYRDAVPTEEVALEVGKAILKGANYGSGEGDDLFEVFYDQSKKVWIVYATLPEGSIGSIPAIVIRKHDGKILKMHFL